jgi:hypothetical protein
MARNATVRQIIGNGWVQVALLSPDSPDLLLFQDGDFHPWSHRNGVLPQVDSSWEWFRGRRDNLDFALLSPAREVPHA